MADTIKGNKFLLICLKDALLELLRERKINEISVKELTEKAGVSRMTFYRNFSTKEDIFKRYLEYTFQNYHKEVTASTRHRATIRYENILLGFKYAEENAELLKCLIDNHLSYTWHDILVQDELGLSAASDVDMKSRYVTVAYANSLYGVLTIWVQNGMKEKPEDLAQVIYDIYKDEIRRY